MIGYFFLGIALLGLILLVLKWFTVAEPRTILVALRWSGLVIALALGTLVLVSGRISWLFYVLPFLLPWLVRGRALSRRFKNYQRMAGGGAAGQASTLETRFLRMTLDHATGDLSGQVTGGPQTGRSLDDLTLSDLLDLLRHYRSADTQSAQVLESYLDRKHPDWRRAAGAGDAGDGGAGAGAAAGGPMTRDEAFQILGLAPGASREEIRAAYHRLIAHLHPDRGGSDYLAAKINQARDVLLGR